MPGATEKEHWSRPSFAAPAKGKQKAGPIFAVLWPDDGKAVSKLTPEQQEEVIAAKPGMYEPVPGAWGERGYTLIRLRGKAAAGTKELKHAVEMAWENVVPTRSARQRSPSQYPKESL